SGIDAWFDEKNLIPGQDWREEIRKAVSESHVVAVCLSEHSLTKKGFVQKKLRFPLDLADEQPTGQIYIIPVRLEDCDVPDRLQRWHWVNLFESDGFLRLLRAIEVRLANIDSRR